MGVFFEQRDAQADPAFQGLRFLIAVLILLIFVGAALWADTAGHSDSSKALYGFATTIMGVVVGLLAGEKSAGK